MLAIRMQRTGRKGHAQFRVIVQDSHRTPTSGKIVASLGHYDPHTKVAVVDKEKASFYLEHGAQPSERIAQLLSREGIKLPSWVTPTTKKAKTIRHSDKLRKNRPADAESVEVPAEPKAETAPAAEDSAEPELAVETSPETETTVPTETAEASESEAPAAEGPKEAVAEEPDKSSKEEVEISTEESSEKA